ncbi:putative fungal fucose-specific lectin [Diplodia seriata]|uniref:Putative fungal fucose-specific lectin n=1 Tax=Diplodia seriata TaxID=420778 RepID=A0A0G2H5V6_9PEZI|nr:putative fungal fucose-specific lectin [Diplodia seriata]
MPSPPRSPLPHSTLEVDVDAQRENERQTQLHHSNSALLPEVYAPSEDKAASAPQVAFDGTLPIPKYPDESAPQVIDTETLPEAVPEAAPKKKTQSRRICGLRRRSFWILVAVGAAAIVAIAVGVGVGVSQSTSGSSSSSGDMTFLSSSNLAAVNFTLNGVDFNCVYYQLGSGEIYQSVWNSTSRAWAVYPVVPDGDGVLKNTPISADLQRKSENVHRHHVFYYDADKVLRAKAADTPYTDTWDDNDGFNGKNYGGDGYSLASYSKECETCYAANAVIYYDGHMQYATPKRDGTDQTAWSQNPLPADLPTPADGTHFALKPLYNGTAGGGKFLVMFMTTNGKKLAKLLYNGSKDVWESETLDVSLAADSAIAAFTAGTFVNGSDSTSNYTMQVLNTHPDESDGGVTLSSYSSSSAAWNTSLLDSGFEKVLNGSGLAANQAGRVYGTVLSDAGSPQLMEWAWDMGNGTYTLTGAVNTNATI